MGIRDTEEMLDAARAECVRLERELGAADLAFSTLRALHNNAIFGVCQECSQPAPCHTTEVLDIVKEARLRILTERQPGGNQ